MRRAFATLVIGSLTSISAYALADDKADCLAAAASGQNFRDAHQLVEARDKFRVCARDVCPVVVQRDCLGWLDAVERSLPTVVVSAKDGDGNDLIDVRVSVDGVAVATRLDGHSMPLDPGPHTFGFELSNGTKFERRVIVKEGSANQDVSVVLGTPTKVAPPVEHAATPIASLPPTPETSVDAWSIAGYSIAGVGIVGLGLGALFGVLAITDRNQANCDASGCDPGPLADARTMATGSTASFVVGGTLFVTGAALLLFAPKSHTPAVRASANGLVWRF
jgi:hypothetical protein